MLLLRLALLFSLLCCSGVLVSAQSLLVSGTVRDARTKEVLPFVSIAANDGETGTTTDLNGTYRLRHSRPITSLRFSYVGYEPQQLFPDSTGRLDVLLYPATSELQEVVIKSGQNPAHRIIRLASRNRERNHIANLNSYTYNTYNKLILTGTDMRKQELDDAAPLSRKDSAYFKMQQLLDKQHLFLMESITEFAYLKPARSKETILATRVSGLQQPSFGIIAEEAREFSVYEDMPVFFGERYLSPLSTGSTRRYDFVLQETTIAGTDTVYIISFEPMQGKSFTGLKGLLYINSNGWAVQNVIAESAHDDKRGMKLQQQFKRIDGRQWFPSELDVEITSLELLLNGHQLFGYVRTYITNVNLNPSLKKSDFGVVALSLAAQAHKQSGSVWEQARPDTLSTLEQRTYERLDSVGKKQNLDRTIRVMEYLVSKQIPIGPLSIDIPRLFRANRFEGARVGLGMHTNRSFSERFTLGGYWGYGLRDEAQKYGADATVLLNQPSELKLNISFQEDVQEPGGRQLPFQQRGTFDKLREPLLPYLDYSTSYQANVSARLLRYLQIQTQLKKAERRPTLFNEERPALLYNLAEASVGVRYAYGEQQMQLFNQNMVMPNRYPVFWLQYTQGLDNVLNGNYSYRKFDIRAEASFLHRSFGESSIRLAGGIVTGNAPLVSLYNGYGSYSEGYEVYAGEGFETMGPYEFFSDKYASIFLVQDFGKRLLRTKFFKPDILLVTNIGVGELDAVLPDFIAERTSSLNKGFYESGLLLNNIISSAFSGIGVGFFYRYGPYALPDQSDNLKIKLTANFAF